jgi:hypothetical protein
MSGTLRIGDDAAWLPAAWAFDAVLGWIADEIEPVDSPVAQRLRDGSAELTGYGFVEVDDLPAARFRALLDATAAVLDRLLVGPVDAVGGPEPFLGLSSALILLVALLRADRRAGQAEHRHGEILLPRGEAWSAPDWVHDLVVERIAAHAAARGDDPVPMLTGRVRRGTGVVDLRLGADAFGERVAPTLRRLAVDYGDGIRGLGRAPAVEPLLAAAVLLLCRQAGVDPEPAG